MFTRNRAYAAVCILLLLTGPAVGPVLAQEGGGDDEEDEDEPVVDIDLDGVIDAINDLADIIRNWDDTLEELLIVVLFAPFRTLAQQLVNYLALILTTTPNVYPNPVVEDVHRTVLIVSYLLSGLVFVWAGVLHIIGPVLGISYSEVRRILPRVILGLVLASVSLPLLQLLVDLTNALVEVFRPEQLSASFTQLAGLSTGLVLAWLINAALLLGLVALFVMRNIYILFVAAISPLLFVLWSLPRVRRYADTFLAGFFAALLVAPLDLLALRFALALLNGTGGTALQSVSNWMLGVGSFALLLIIPYQVWGASQAAVGSAYSIASTIRKKRQSTTHGLTDEEAGRLKRNAERRRQSGNSDDFDDTEYLNDD